MSLFAVKRYLGEEEDGRESKQEAGDILKKLQNEAKARRKSLKKEKDEVTIVTVSNAAEDNFTSSPVDVDNTDDSPERSRNQRKKKNRKRTESPSNEVNILDNVAEKEKVKKKKKRKHEEAEEGNNSVGLNETESESPVKKKKIEEQESVDSETKEGIKGKKNKKHKKHKHRHTEYIDEEGDHSLQEDGEKCETEVLDTEQNIAGSGSMEVDENENLENETDRDIDEKATFVGSGKETEIGGFTVIGNVRPAKLQKVHRVLPEWLSSPSVISSDLSADNLPVSEMPGLAEDLVDKLKENNITHFFPVQRQVIPALLESSLTGFHIGRAGYRPSDICVSAPTGSGKTLAFILPIVQALRSRVTCEVRALAVLPVRDLATQVFNVFQTYCKGTNLKVGLMVGQKTLLAEQHSLVKKRLHGYQSTMDIIVATPGRLVDHINQTEGFNLGHLRYLVIDEADRMMEEIKQDWLIQLETAVYRSRPRPGPLTVTSCQKMQMPLQKLLYSATLSQNPEKLQQLNLFQPKLFTSVVKSISKPLSQTVKNKQESGKTTEQHVNGDADCDIEMENDTEADKAANEADGNKSNIDDGQTTEKAGDFVGKYATPTSLSEYYIETTSGEKPLIVLHLLHHLKYRNILCFTNSVESTHRLFMLIKLYGGIQVKEFSSNLNGARRKAILQKFETGKIDILVCSDAMARGMDITTVKYVVSYDPPAYIQTYIHRIGRTARAGKEGTAFTLLQKKEFFHFKKMTRQAGKASVRAMKIVKDDVKALLPKYEETLKQLSQIIKDDKPKKKYTQKKPQKSEIKNNTG